MSLILATLLPLSLVGSTEGASYVEAHRQTAETGKPLVVMVSTDWCPPCQQMKRNVIPRVREHGLLGKVAFAVVNPDEERDLADRITGGGPIPQLVLYRKTPQGWHREKLVGGQSVETVEQFIEKAVAENEAEQSAQPIHGTPARAASASATEGVLVLPASLRK
ncbi:MAG: thioredoxin family protein [Planctomycetota bacterium]